MCGWLTSPYSKLNEDMESGFIRDAMPPEK